MEHHTRILRIVRRSNSLAFAWTFYLVVWQQETMPGLLG